MLPRSSSGYLYTVLQVDRNASEDAIRRQYRRLAMQYHPDRTGGRTTEHFKEIEEAHRVLADPDQRVLYDAVGRNGLKQLGDLGVPRFMRSLSALQAAIFLTGCVLTALLLAMALTCYKLDHTQAARKLPWGLVLLPLWVLCPLFLLSGSLVCLAAVSTALDWQSVVRGMQLIALGVVCATTAAVLSGMLAPLWALLPWLLVQLLSTLQQMYLFKPSAYCRCYEDDGHAPHRHTDATSPLQPPTMATASSGNRYNNNNNDAAAAAATATAASSDVWGTNRGDGNARHPGRPLRSHYVAYVVNTLFENACVWAFFALALTRVLQGGRATTATTHASSYGTVDHARHVKHATAAGGHATTMTTTRFRYKDANERDADTTHHVLSFYIIALPLVLLFAVRTLRAAMAPCMAMTRTRAAAAAADDEGARAPLLHTDRARNDFVSGNNNNVDDHDHVMSSSLAERVCASVMYSLVPAAMLYMTCMWASKAEHEYNGNKHAYDPSAMTATLPVLALLTLLTIVSFVAMCLVAVFVKGMYHHGGNVSNSSSNSTTRTYTTTTTDADAAQQQQQQPGGSGPAAAEHGAAHVRRDRNADID